jgi:threonine/homoserine/homoserine lactone efflux protein
MTKLITLFTTSLIVGFSGALMPGPLLTVVISGSARRGFWEGPALVLGHAVAEALIVAALAAGLSRLLKRNLVAGLIGLLGGAFLLWMGFDIARSAWLGTVSLEQATGAEAGLQPGPIITGIVVSISNPYWVLWWATVGASYVALSLGRGSLGLGSFYIGHILSDLSWYSLVALLIARGKALLSQPIYRLILLVCGLFLMSLSIYFVYSGIRFLRGKAISPSDSRNQIL